MKTNCTYPGVAICAIGKRENKYIREWVEYYKKLGVSRIYLADNNDIGEEHLWAPIQDYICDNFVNVFNYVGKINVGPWEQSTQNQAYDMMYRQSNYEWNAFVDIDEFIYINSGKPIYEELSDNRFAGCQMIQMNWQIYNDNDLIYEDGRLCQEKFVVPLNKDFMPNQHVKSIIKGKLSPSEMSWVNVQIPGQEEYVITPHTPYTSNEIVTKNFSGEVTQMGNTHYIENALSKTVDWKFGCIKHYLYKTIEEFCKYKLNKTTNYWYTKTFDDFFMINEKTPEKLEVIRKYGYEYF